jgi:hypothetical protein
MQQQPFGCDVVGGTNCWLSAGAGFSTRQDWTTSGFAYYRGSRRAVNVLLSGQDPNRLVAAVRGLAGLMAVAHSFVKPRAQLVELFEREPCGC